MEHEGLARVARATLAATLSISIALGSTPSLAFAAVTSETVKVENNSREIDGDVVVTGDSFVTAVDARGDSSDVSLAVTGHVSAEAPKGATAVNATADGVMTDVTTGGASATSAGGLAEGVHACSDKLADTTGTLNATVNGSIDVSGDDAFGVYAKADNESSATVDVKTDVTAKAGESGATGVDAYAYSGGTMTVTIGNDLSTTSEEDDAEGIYASASEGGSLTVAVGNNVTAKAGESGAHSAGISSHAESGGSTTITVGNDVTVAAKTEEVEGVHADTLDDGIAVVAVGGNVVAEGGSSAQGVSASGLKPARTAGNNDADAPKADSEIESADGVTVTVDGDVLVSATDSAEGISVENAGGSTTIRTGDVSVESGRNASGVSVRHVGINMWDDEAEAFLEEPSADGEVSIETGRIAVTATAAGERSEGDGGAGSPQSAATGVSISGRGNNTVVVRGDLSVTNDEGSSIGARLAPENGEVSIVVEGTISGEVPLVVSLDGNSGVNVTAWKIENVDKTELHSADEGLEEGQGTTLEDFLGSINYILRFDDAMTEDTISLLSVLSKGVTSDLGELAPDSEYRTAHAGDEITIKVPDGFYVMNGDEELATDEDGNYLLIVPDGGGVLIRVAQREAEPEGSGSQSQVPSDPIVPFDRTDRVEKPGRASRSDRSDSDGDVVSSDSTRQQAAQPTTVTPSAKSVAANVAAVKGDAGAYLGEGSEALDSARAIAQTQEGGSLIITNVVDLGSVDGTTARVDLVTPIKAGTTVAVLIGIPDANGQIQWTVVYGQIDENGQLVFDVSDEIAALIASGKAIACVASDASALL